MPKTCMKCGKSFPIKVTIDNVVHNLCSRKYCLECSAFNLHNTQKIHLPKKQEKKYDGEKVKRWRRRTKQKSVEYKGGKCKICGYNKCITALDFHHLNPKEKKFRVSSGNIKAWNTIKKELDKCILVCCRCHREIHAGLIKIEDPC